MGDFRDAWWQQTYQVKSIVIGNVRTLRPTLTMEIYLVSLLPSSVSKSPIGLYTSFSSWSSGSSNKFSGTWVPLTSAIVSMTFFASLYLFFEMSHRGDSGRNLWKGIALLKTPDTIGDCQRPVFPLGVSQHAHKITKLWKFELNWSSKLRDNNERNK